MTIPFETRIGQCQWLFATQPRQKPSGAKRLREGRGQGRGADYKPWLDVQQVPSLGLSERIRGWKSNRVHHLFSQLEVNYFYALEWSESVTDIREQYPQRPLDETLDIAQACGFTHPTAPSREYARPLRYRTTQPIVMTTDFLVTVGQSMGVTEIARTVKPSGKLQEKRILEKFEIERRYWENRNISWGIVTEHEIPSQLMLALSNATANKVQFCREYGIEITQDQWPTHHLPEAILADRGELLSANANNLVNALGIRIANTPPYRPDWKPIVERQFRLNNDEVIHWVPGAVYHPRERGDKDTRLDAVLDLNEFRQLMIHLIVHYNSCHRLDEYPMDKFMIADGVEPYPIDLWQWGIENRGRPRTCTPEIVRLNLLPTGSATVTERGIRFEKLFYTCELALSEQWFVKARVGKSWKIPIAYDPRNLNTIYLRLDNSKRVEACKLLDTCKTFKERDWYEAVDYWALKKQAKATAFGSVGD